jgi:small subunit ribosomal protein S18
MHFYQPTPKTCKLHTEPAIDYKDWQFLSRFISRYGKIDPRRRTGLCPVHQKMLARAIKHAREIALLPYTARKS